MCSQGKTNPRSSPTSCLGAPWGAGGDPRARKRRVVAQFVASAGYVQLTKELGVSGLVKFRGDFRDLLIVDGRSDPFSVGCEGDGKCSRGPSRMEEHLINQSHMEG
jgi:hypothetical protein